MQKKIITYIILFIMTISISIYSYATEITLEQFVNDYKVTVMSDEQIEAKLKELQEKIANNGYREDYLQDVKMVEEQIRGMKAAEQIKYLDESFEGICARIGTETYSEEEDPGYLFYQYYGYALGKDRAVAVKNQKEIGDVNTQSQDDIQKKIDNLLEKCEGETHKDTLETYRKQLTELNQSITDKTKQKENQTNIDNIYTNMVNIQNQEAANKSPGVLGESSASANHTLDEIIKEGQSFIQSGTEGDKISETTLKSASDTLYNILLVIGIAMAVIIGMYLGVKFMLSSAEDKAKVKEALIPYIAGCVVIFGAFIIWKLVIVLLGGIA